MNGARELSIEVEVTALDVDVMQVGVWSDGDIPPCLYVCLMRSVMNVDVVHANIGRAVMASGR